MLPPALGGLRVLRAAGPRPSCTRDYRKDQCRAVPARRCNYTTSALSPSNRKIKNQARRNEIMVRTKLHIPRRPKGGAAKRALCGVHICRGKAGASEMRPYPDDATDVPRGSGGGVSAQCDQQRKSCASATSRGVGADCRTRARLRARRDFDRHGKWRA
jgi:hypothetical protein